MVSEAPPEANSLNRTCRRPSAHPVHISKRRKKDRGLRLAVEGYTDSVGSDDYNQKLSEDRGTTVRDYLTQEGVVGTSVTSQGFGKSQPVASNDTAAGRQQNRRVELVLSGEIIGEQIGQPVAVR